MSNETKHTPGPWSCNINGEIRSPKGDIVAQVYDNPGEEESLLNIPLIAAAPDMLQALCKIDSNAAESYKWIRRVAREAIAKATAGNGVRTMNIQLLRQIQEKILANPDEFVTHGWGHCISSWAQNLPLQRELEDSYEGAMEALQIDQLDGEGFFYVSKWPEPFRTRFRQSKLNVQPKEEMAKGRAKIAAERIEHFISTNGEE